MTKSVASILLIVTLAGSIIDLHDLNKFPRLIEHFKEHQQKSPGVSFITFLNLHYGSLADQHDKEEHEEHKGLPFKSPDCTFAHTQTLLSRFKAPELTSLNSFVTYSKFYQSTFTAQFSQSIWQPPKKA